MISAYTINVALQMQTMQMQQSKESTLLIQATTGTEWNTVATSVNGHAINQITCGQKRFIIATHFTQISTYLVENCTMHTENVSFAGITRLQEIEYSRFWEKQKFKTYLCKLSPWLPVSCSFEHKVAIEQGDPFAWSLTLATMCALRRCHQQIPEMVVEYLATKNRGLAPELQ